PTAAIKNGQTTVARGGAITITFNVQNQGEGDAAATTAKFLLVDSQTNAVVTNLNGTQAISSLRSGASTSTITKTVTVFASTPVGTSFVQACADSLDVVAEASETNNCTSTPTTITVQ